ncbi:helix-turn-helix domain-containing protein [Candidatus Leptofilum sp.]|uniref:helix-turn-helix domain-containing protein n=1 Tax=Candidatus Leptofilum sp. TaxID=3241576 RepID=UPI003B5C9B0C
MRKIELVIHPVRFQILQALGTETLTTQEIADRLPGTPKSSIYRHLKLLLDHALIVVADTRLVNGIQEKTYRLDQPTHLGPEDMASLSTDDHIRFFTTYALTLVQDYSRYVTENEPIDMVADRTGYTEVTFYATNTELDSFQHAINTALLRLLGNEPGNGRTRRKLAIVSQPLPNGNQNEE